MIAIGDRVATRDRGEGVVSAVYGTIRQRIDGPRGVLVTVDLDAPFKDDNGTVTRVEEIIWDE